ncbi:MAG: hypothetical protein ACTSUX_06880 [Promethearchaeota archaeon]
MYEEKNTNGLPSYDIFNNTAPDNEYLTNIQSISTIEHSSIKISLYNKIIPAYPIYNRNQKILKEGKDQILKKKIIKIYKSKKFLMYIKKNKQYSEFTRILENFLIKYFELSFIKPKECIFELFEFPGEDYVEPMIKIIYYDDKNFNNLKIRDNIEENFKIYLLKLSKNIEEFKRYRKFQKKFRFVVRRE